MRERENRIQLLIHFQMLEEPKLCYLVVKANARTPKLHQDLHKDESGFKCLKDHSASQNAFVSQLHGNWSCWDWNQHSDEMWTSRDLTHCSTMPVPLAFVSWEQERKIITLLWNSYETQLHFLRCVLNRCQIQYKILISTMIFLIWSHFGSK